MNKITKIFRKAHYSIGLILFVLAAACMYDVFYMRTQSNFVPEPFSYLDPSIVISLLIGIVPIAVLSFGKEKSLFQKHGEGFLGNVFSGLINIGGLCLLNMYVIYMTNILSNSNFYERRQSIPYLYLTLTILQLLFAIASLMYSEYVIYRNEDKEKSIPTKQLIIQGVLYGLSLSLYIVCLIVSSYGIR